jgi:hypothetical protein
LEEGFLKTKIFVIFIAFLYFCGHSLLLWLIFCSFSFRPLLAEWSTFLFTYFPNKTFGQEQVTKIRPNTFSFREEN